MDHDIVSALVKVVEMKDHSTAAHTWRVALYTQALAEAAGLEPAHIPRLMHAAVLHDIGKIDIPSAILGKPGRLTPEEFEIMKTHTTLGHDRLLRMGETDPLILALVRSHHERLDGTGYPDGLGGEAIPTAAAHFAVIDTFDAMTSLRPYRRDVGRDAAKRSIDELNRKSGIWYSPDAVTLFTGAFESGQLDWILHHLNSGESMIDLAPAPDADTLITARRDVLQRGRPAVK